MAVVGFTFQGQELSVLTDENGNPWFSKVEVSKVLGISGRATSKYNFNAKGVVRFTTPSSGGPQSAVYISEGNLYRLVLRSNKKEAEAFTDWVCEEVLPSIRKKQEPAAFKPEQPTAKPREGFLSIRASLYLALTKADEELAAIKAKKKRRDRKLL